MRSDLNTSRSIGLGLLGGSIGLAVRPEHLRALDRRLRQRTTKCDARRRARRGLVEDGLRERGRCRDRRRPRDPVRAGRRLARGGREIATRLAARCDRDRRRLVKAAVIRDVARPRARRRAFHPGHPIAGTEHSGPDAGFAELFDGRWCILTPPPDADPEAVAALERFWHALGLERRDHGRRAPRPRARGHQPRAAPDRLQHRRHRRATSRTSPTAR